MSEENKKEQQSNNEQPKKRTFEEACKECNAVPIEVFYHEGLKKIEEYYKEHGLN